VFGKVFGSTDGPDAAAPLAVASVAPPMIAEDAGGRAFSATEAEPGGRVDATIWTGATATATGFCPTGTDFTCSRRPRSMMETVFESLLAT
jgi:hypothetical protein